MSLGRSRRALCLLALAVSLAGCGVTSQASPSRVTSHDLAAAGQPTTAPQATASTQVPGAAGEVDVYFLRAQRLVAVPRTVDLVDVPGPAIQALLAGPSEEELGDRITTAIPSGTPTLDVTVVSGIAVVGVPPQFDSLSVPEQILVVAQLTYTLTGIHGIVGLQLTDHGTLVDVPNGSGELSNGPVYRADFGALGSAGGPATTTPSSSDAAAT